MGKAKVAIVLPVYNVIKYLPVMINSLYNSTKFPFKLIVVDGFSKDGTFEYIKTIKEGCNNDIEIYQIPKKGLVNAINFGINKAKNLDVYLTQADVIHFRLFKRDWLKEMYNESKDKEVGFLIGINGGGISGESFIDGFRWAGTWNTYIPRKTFKKIGLFDENFGPGDDIDYSYRVMLKGLKGIMMDFWVQHHRLTDHADSDEEQKILRMGKKFKRKWGL